MKMDVIVYFLIIIFYILLIRPFIWVKEGFDDCIVGTLSDMKSEISQLKDQVKKNTQELNQLVPAETTQSQPEMQPPTDGETQTYSKLSNMPEIMNSFGN